jgi:hypothetical protein
MRCVHRASLLLGLSLVAASGSARTWSALLSDGTNSKLFISGHSGMLEFQREGDGAFTIPASSITGLSHSTRPISRALAIYKYFDKNGRPDDNGLLPLVAGVASMPLGHSKRHYVEIEWDFQGLGAIVLELGKNEYIPFLNWLEHSSGKKSVDVDKERERSVRQMAGREHQAFPVSLPDPQGEDSSRLTFTHYKALPAEWHGRTELYLFDGDVKPGNLAGVLPVSAKWEDNRCVDDSAVIYGKCSRNGCEVKAVLLPTLTFQVLLTSSPESEEAACAQLGEQQKREKSAGRVILR